MTTPMRTHVVMPRELVEEVDRLVGSRRRSRFITDAVEEKLARHRRAEVARAVGGSLADVDIPGWENSEAAVEWVRALRQSGGPPISDACDPAPSTQ